jgi:signal transduction histidine kinase/GAF domain-containing protein
MHILEQVFDVITRPPGDLVYFLVVLFALLQALVSAATAYRARPERALARRWLWATGGMLVARLLLVAFGLVSVGGLIPPTAVLPALERWVLFLHLLGLLWAGFLWGRFERWQVPVLVGGLVVSLVILGYGVALQVLPSLVSPVQPPSVLEIVALLLVSLLTFVFAGLTRPPEWEWGVGTVFFWVLGALGQLLWADPLMPIDGWLRLSSLVALPLLSLWVHRQLMVGLPLPPSEESVEGTAEAAADLIYARPLLETLHIVRAARDLNASLILAAARLAKLLDAEMCAIVIADEPSGSATSDAEPMSEATMVRVVAIHPPTSAQVHPPTLAVADYAGLALAEKHRQAVVATPPDDEIWLTPLYTALGFDHPSSLVALPLLRAGRFLGFLLLGGPVDREQWTDADLETLVFVAEQMSLAIAATQQRQGMLPARSTAVGADAPVATVQETGVSAAPDLERAAMQRALDKAKAQFQELNGRIRTLLQEIKARDEEIIALNQELESRRRGASESELSVWQHEVRQLVDEREGFERRIQEMTEDRDLLLGERSRLSKALDEMQTQLSRVESHRERLEEELLGLMTQLEERDAAIADLRATMPASLESEGSEATPSAAVHVGAVGILIADEDGKITTADSVARQMLRLPEGDVVGMPVDGAYADPQWSRAIDDLLVPRQKGGLDRNHLTLLLDESATVEADFASLRGNNGHADGLVITLRSSKSETERYDALISLVSDFRTPMTAITGYADLLLGEQAGILTEMQQQFLERVKANIEQLHVLLNDLIRVTSPDTRPIELRPQPVNVIEIIEEAIMGLAARFRERRLTVQLDLPPELASVEADRDSLYQIMLRLLSNAAVCSEEGSQIVVSAHEETFEDSDKHLQISVTDTGGGIAPEDYPRVFRHFYRATQPLIEGMGETSVGMAMAKTLVEANGGRIWVESEEGVGSTLSFLLPCGAET